MELIPASCQYGWWQCVEQADHTVAANYDIGLVYMSVLKLDRWRVQVDAVYIAAEPDPDSHPAGFVEEHRHVVRSMDQPTRSGMSKKNAGPKAASQHNMVFMDRIFKRQGKRTATVHRRAPRTESDLYVKVSRHRRT